MSRPIAWLGACGLRRKSARAPSVPRAKHLIALAVAGLLALMPAHTKTAVAARHLGDIDLITAGVIEEGSLARRVAVASESSGTAPFAANEGAPTSNAPTITATITD